MAGCRSWRLPGRCRVIDPRLTWFAAGATCSAVVFGWPWRPRFSRIVPRDARLITFPDPAPDRQPTNPFIGDPVKPQPPQGRVVDIHGPTIGYIIHGPTIGYIPRPQSDTPTP